MKFFETLKYEAIDWGRVYLVKEYQNQSMVWQYLIWKGLLYQLCSNPKCRYVFGTCSISNDFSQVTKELLVSYFLTHHADLNLSRLVHPHNPFQHDEKIPMSLIERLLGRIESIGDLETCVRLLDNGKRIPSVLNTYLGFGAKAFTSVEDPDFNTVDIGFVLDLMSVHRNKPKLLQKTMGKENYENFVKRFS